MDIDTLQKTLSKKLKGVVIRTAKDGSSSSTGEIIDNIPTGSSVLDYYVIGNGGIPVPRISVFSGQFSSGKSTFSQNVIANAQKNGYDCYLIEMERVLDKKRLEYIGVDLDTLKIVSVDTDESRFTVESLFELLEAILLNVDTKSFIVVDSLNALQSNAEADTTMMQNASMASTARAIKKGMKKVNDLLPERMSAILFITSVYMNISGYGDKYIEYGGSGVNYYASTMTRFTIKKKEKDEYYQIVSAKNIKNKTSTPFREENIYLAYDGRIIDSYSILDIAYKEKIIQRKGAWYAYNGQSFQKKTLAEQPFYSELKEKVIDTLKSKVKQYRGNI